MNSFVAASGPTGALLHAQGVVGAANEKLAAGHLLEVAFQAEVGVPLGQQFGVDGPMSRVAGRAAFPHGFMLEDKRTALGGMATEAAFVFGEQRGAAAGVNRAFMRRMAIGAAHAAFGHGMMAGEAELAAHISMALETEGFDRAGGRDGETRAVTAASGTSGSEAIRGFDFTAGIGVEAARAVAGFATGAERVRSRRDQPRVIGRRKPSVDLIVALFTFFGTDVLGAGDIGKHHDRPVNTAAGTGGQEQEAGPGRNGQPAPASREAFCDFAEIQIYHGLSVAEQGERSALIAQLRVNPCGGRVQKSRGIVKVMDAVTAVVKNQVEVKPGFSDVDRQQRLFGGVGAGAAGGQISGGSILPGAATVFGP